VSDAEDHRLRIRAEWPAEYDNGLRCGLLNEFPKPREQGGYPIGFHSWPLVRRNAWFAGFNKGYTLRKKEMPND